MEVIFLSINILFYVFFFKKHLTSKGFDVVCFLTLIYIVIATMGLLLYLNPKSSGLYTISLLPQLLLFFVFLLTIRPINNCATITRGTIIHPSSFVFTSFIVFIAAISLLRFPGLLANISQNLMSIIYDSSYLSDTYVDLHNRGASGFSTGSFNVVAILGGMIDSVAIFFLMYYLSRVDKKLWVIVVLIVAAVLAPLGALVQARRGTMVFSILNFIAFYLLFRKCYSSKLRKLVQRVLLVIISFIAIGVALITISRFTKSSMDDDYAVYSIILYLGQPMLNLDLAVMDPGGCRWGDRTIPLFKSFFVDGAYSYDERIIKYSYMNLGEEVFSTYFGEIVLDFGVILSILFLIVWMFWMYKMGPEKKQNFPFYQLLPIVMLINILVGGWTQSPFSDIGGNLHFIFILLLYIYFKQPSRRML